MKVWLLLPRVQLSTGAGAQGQGGSRNMQLRTGEGATTEERGPRHQKILRLRHGFGLSRTNCPLYKWQIKMTHWLRCHKSLGVGWVSERTENDQKWKRKIKGGGWGLSSHSRITTLSPGWADCYMLTTRAGGHMHKEEGVKIKGIEKFKL